MLGFCIVSAIYLGGTTSAERRQYAVNSWQTVTNSICTLELDFVLQLQTAVFLSKSELKYYNQIAQMKAASFDVLNRSFCVGGRILDDFIGNRKHQDVPILVAFSNRVAEEIVRGDLPCLVLPPRGFEALQLPRPDVIRAPDDFDDDEAMNRFIGISGRAPYISHTYPRA